MGLLLLIMSMLLSVVLIPIGFAYAIIKLIIKRTFFSTFFQYCKDCAIMIDRFGNVAMRYLFNDVLIKENGYRFGQFDETISGVLGKNYRAKTLRFMGEELSEGLNDVDKNHVIKSIDENPKKI